MKNFNFTRLFGNNPNSTSNIAKRKRQRRRTCRIEELEGREMLSATPFEAHYDNSPGDEAVPFVVVSEQNIAASTSTV